MIRRPPRSTLDRSSAASDVYKRQALIGAAQGWFVAYFHIPSFIVTLAGMLVFKGLALALLNGQSVGPFPELSLIHISEPTRPY